MGSGHILVYAFDVLMEIYRECGYSDRDAALNIVQQNLFGLDIDKRAYQLAYFAVMMKARSYNRRALTQNVSNNLAYIEESNAVSKFTHAGLTTDEEQNKIGEYLVQAFRHAQEIGSLQTVEKKDYKAFAEYLVNTETQDEQMDLFSADWFETTKPLMLRLTKQAHIMSNKYAVVCTNPPYMNKLEGHLKKFVTDNYKPYSGDLFSVFIYRNFAYCKSGGYSAFMTPNVWMFIKTYENLRSYILNKKSIITLVQMAKGAFFKEATVDICAFVLKNAKETEKGLYFRLEDFKGDMEVQRQKVLEALENNDCGYFYESDQSNFSKIPGSPIAYWISDKMQRVFQNGKVLLSIGKPEQGMATADNNRFVRCWYEVDIEKTAINRGGSKKWFPYNNGGGFRKWYGFNIDVVNWENDGKEIKAFPKAYVRNERDYFKSGITWNAITSSDVSVRYFGEGFIFSNAGMAIFTNEQYQKYLLALINSCVSKTILTILSPTLNYNAGDMGNIPVIYSDIINESLLSDRCIVISKSDWDSFETSWDFEKHPLIRPVLSVSEAYEQWENECENRFNQLKANEEELNRIFIDIYGLQDELTPDVEDKDVTVRKADLQRDIKSLISYAVGCMLGRYSLDVDGLAYAGGQWDNSKYSTFVPDADNCIPITDEEYFEDDIVGLLCDWLKKVYGEDTLEENLDFIAKALGNKGSTSREIIRNYFLNDFIKDHIKTYQKRPIYWLFDSGKQNGFKALCYMHRWNADTIGHMRVEYLHRMQRVYDKEIECMQEIIDNSRDNKEINKATKRKEKLKKQLKETEDYDAMVAHLALSRIDIDLDDGVKVNYEKVQTAKDGNKMQILVKI